jgi:hypothetical protein
MRGTFVHGQRNLTPTPVPDDAELGRAPSPTSIPVRLASTARAVFDRSAGYHPWNLSTYLRSHALPDPGTEERAVALPRAGSEA